MTILDKCYGSSMRILLLLLALVVGCDKASTAAPSSGSASGSAAPTTAKSDGGGATVNTGSAAIAMGTPAATQEWKVGDKIQGKWSDGRWYNGKISAVNDDHTWNIKYDDGDVSNHFKADRIRARQTSSNTGGGGGGGHAGAGNAPCPGPGLTRRCGGVCVNIQEDNNNCGSCGTRCTGGKHCDGHMFCRDAAGNL